MAENTKQFFQITEAARACGLSRSTLMRMEERGLLTPVFTAPDSGRRYYDNHNVARIMQIEKFKAMGLGSKEIADYFAQGGEAEVLLEALKPAQERLRLHPVLPPGVEHDLDGHGTAHAFIHEVVGLPQRKGFREHPRRARLHFNQGVPVYGHPEQHHKQRQQYLGIPNIDPVDPAEETVEDVRFSDPDRRYRGSSTGGRTGHPRSGRGRRLIPLRAVKEQHNEDRNNDPLHNEYLHFYNGFQRAC